MTGSSSGISKGVAPGSQSSVDQLNAEMQAKANENSISESHTMPNHSVAITPKEKFVNYSLDYDNPKAKGKAEAYEKGLGYTKKNASGLINQIHSAVTSSTAHPYEVSKTEYGVKYKFRISITGPNGKTKKVIAVYQIDNGNDVPRLITNYLEGK